MLRALLAIALTSACGTTSSSAVTAPIVVHDKFTAGVPGMLIPVQVGPPGSPTAQVVLDTGSSGLRILASALGSDTYQRTGMQVTETFDNGMVFDGEQATAIVAVGDAATPQPIIIEVVDSVSCSTSDPDCVGAVGESALTDVGTMGIFGVGLRDYSSSTLFSPIAQLATAMQTYSVHLDSDGTSGTLTIDPSDLASYQMLALAADPSGAQHPNGAPAWNDLAVPVCYAVAAAPVTQPCAAETLFDSGTSEVILLDGDIPPGDQGTDGFLEPGTMFEASMTGVFDWMTTATAEQIYVAAGPAGSFARILGMPFFATHDVAFDIQAGTIGIRDE
jgi:hypothetical protein